MLGYRLENWWEKKVFLGITRNSLLLYSIIAITAMTMYFTDWNRVFGLR
jgi:hypothetical protein